MVLHAGGIGTSETSTSSCGSNYDSLFARTVAYPVQVAYWIKRSWPPADTVSHVNFDQWSEDMVLGAGGDPRMTGCLESPLVSPVLAQSWSQTATDGAWFSTTALPSGRDRPRCLYVLRLSGSEPKTRRTGSVATSLPSNSLLVARAGNVELDRYPQLMLPGAEIR